MHGLILFGDFALVGLSKPRHNKTFSGLVLDATLKLRNAGRACSVQIINFRTGDALHWLRMEGVVAELYDVVLCLICISPMALGFKADEIRRVLSVET